ncbi:response regulator [Vreelandella alkaliphila]|uniref:response regulator n=1 Tax=Halomonadaceae TaxID=28256 RepID=UPI001E3D8082|nr:MULTISPECIES: response regulator transcription factor [Halomonas]MCD6006071.1 response regulator transcription factor [Halomonas sp. IOP_6]MCD6438199.1 response regulator transcription factor [Halomonas sp.]
MTLERPKVLVIEDEPHIRQFLRISLSSQGFQIIEADTGQAGIRALVTSEKSAITGVDLVLLDLGLPDMDGQQVLDEIRCQSEVPIIVVSVRGNETEKVRALDNGANDYVTKPFGIQELLARIRALLRRRELNTTPHRYHYGNLTVDLSAHVVTLNDHIIHLTPKEFSVLTLLISHAGRLVTQTHLLRDIWGPTHQEDTHYLRIVVSKLRQKLGDNPQSPSLLQTEQGIGYRLCVDLDRKEHQQ